MSDTDPYMAQDASAPVVEVAKNEKVEEKPSIEVPEGSIKEVLTWVGEDVDKAKAALEVEVAGENRKTLVTKLKEIVD